MANENSSSANRGWPGAARTNSGRASRPPSAACSLVPGGGSFQLSLVTAGTLLLIGAALAVFIKPPQQKN